MLNKIKPFLNLKTIVILLVLILIATIGIQRCQLKKLKSKTTNQQINTEQKQLVEELRVKIKELPPNEKADWGNKLYAD